jgi:hypothetical protein
MKNPFMYLSKNTYQFINKMYRWTMPLSCMWPTNRSTDVENKQDKVVLNQVKNVKKTKGYFWSKVAKNYYYFTNKRGSRSIFLAFFARFTIFDKISLTLLWKVGQFGLNIRATGKP